MAQKDEILTALTYNSLTPLDALRKHNCFRLAARIKELRDDGHHIHTLRETTNTGKSIARYCLIEKAAPN